MPTLQVPPPFEAAEPFEESGIEILPAIEAKGLDPLAPADIVTQVLNFGLSASIDVQVAGPRGALAANETIARQIRAEVAKVPGVVDVHLQQVPWTPDLRVNVDRSAALNVSEPNADAPSFRAMTT